MTAKNAEKTAARALQARTGRPYQGCVNIIRKLRGEGLSPADALARALDDAAPKRPADAFPGDKPTGRRRTFSVTVSKTVEVSFDESVIAQGTLPDGYILGPNPTESAALEHLAFNIVGNGLRLSHIDGYANCPDASASVKDAPWEVEINHEVSP